MAVGNYNTSSTHPSLSERWNGNSWAVKSVPSPAGATSSGLVGVSCTSGAACTAVGAYYKVPVDVPIALAERFNGNIWVVQSVPVPAGATSSRLFGVSCTSATACTAVGQYRISGASVTLAERWNGNTNTWTVQSTPNPAGALSSSLAGVSCPSAIACIAVGQYQDGSGTTLTLAERWNGGTNTWTIESTVDPAGAQASSLAGVSCTSATACTAVGFYFSSSGSDLPLAERYTGTWGLQAGLQAPPNPAGATASFLAGVSCTSATACTAVGHYNNSSGTSVTLAEGWNGNTNSWTVQSTPNPAGATSSTLVGVSCLPESFCTAVGHDVNSSGTTVTLAEHIRAWTVQPTPNPSGATDNLLSGVSCTSPTACIAVGYDSNAGANTRSALAEHWNGTSWVIKTAPSPTGVTYSLLSGISCTSGTACTAVGYYSTGANTRFALAERWNGSTWTIQPTANLAGVTYSYLTGVSCTSATACIAVGSYNNGTADVSLAEIWDGNTNTWTTQATANPVGGTATVLNGVSCTSGTACTAVGSHHNASGNVTLAERYTGTWGLQTTANPTGVANSYLRGVSCASATACTAVGYDNNGTADTTLAERWDGTTWVIKPAPPPTGATASILSGVSCTSAASCTAVGYYVNSSATFVTLAEHWNGTTWAVQPTPNPTGATHSVLAGISCTSATACSAVGLYADSSAVPFTLAERYA